MNPGNWVKDGQAYFRDVRSEFGKIVWPSQREAVGGTVGVVIIVAFLTLVLGLFDVALSGLMEVAFG